MSEPAGPSGIGAASGVGVLTGGESTGLANGKSTRAGDRIFRSLTTGTGVLVLILIAAITVFLIAKAVPAITADHVNFLSTKSFAPDDDPSKWGVEALIYGSVVSSFVAILLGVPVAIGVALFIAFYAPKKLVALFSGLIDLLAAVPSVVYGFWGLAFLVPKMTDFSAFLDRYFGWFPPLHSTTGTYGRSLLTAGIILAIMILPIVAAISREVFFQVPAENIDAARALGATRWEMLRTAVLPYSRPGITSGVLLGFGRAIGETIAVALVLSPSYIISSHITSPGGNTVAANIANSYGDAMKNGVGALIASGLVLFVITLIVNSAARVVVARAANRMAS